MTEHVLTTNGMGYFWCSCNPHRAHVLWSLNEHIAEIAAEDAAPAGGVDAIAAVLAAAGGVDAIVARLEALAAEAEAGGDHPTATRIRAALYDDQESE